MRRFVRYDHFGNVIGEVSENDIMALERREVINGEHSLTITTFQVLGKNERIVYQDGRGVWREYVVVGVDEEHASGNRVVGTYYCVWSIQVDLAGVPVSVMPGVQSAVYASTALDSALSTQHRWGRGTVTNTATAGASMYDTNAWKAMGVLVENWGGELSTTIGVSSDGVITRLVDLYAQQGDSNAKRRFDFGADLQSVKRIHSDEPYYCRISPRGKGEATDGGGYGRKITIESVNGGLDYLEYAPMVEICKLPDGNGFSYPTLQVENSKCETPAALKEWALVVLESYCTPKVTYEVNAVQAAVEGVDVQGVSLGDTVHIVDGYFGDGLRLSGRVTEMTVDELNEKSITVKIGYIGDTLANTITSTAKQVAQMQQAMSTAEYIQNLLDRINAEINATGGYTYITEGQGIRAYDTAVSDPLVGSEASAVVEIKGGTIRIANSKTAQGEWEWKSVFTSGHIAANLVTAANITTGYISDASGVNSWNLDTGVFSTAQGYIGGFTIGSSALYNNLSSLYGTTQGVYVGTDGLASSYNTGGENRRIVVKDGVITGYKNSVVHGAIKPVYSTNIINADSGTVIASANGLEISGGILSLDCDYVSIKAENSSYVGSNAEIHGWVLSNTSDANNIYTAYPTNLVMYHKSGLLYRTIALTDSVPIKFAKKEYVDGKKWSADDITSGTLATARIPTLAISKISGLQSALNSKLESSALNGYATQNWVSNNFASSGDIPTFSRSGSTLTITT